ncbi:Endonuclease, Uma2 family (restriction endonuclease fold) [Thiohalospira halophila DSM 15071]|uniref:Endonuclease, Uma2 family (Restriction endonuclease fold) n=1 Tax=Thiohalospira halophila DSM 15071 TaxID=1123397 RepID=A0A1I1Q514_9GAMM|nr:Uma2 family endonuclease [Thiohalospira halophila]SFD17221.1 Endonuclease, Uma2 family (restriction endonuclease fold) [Thiohalospira halophila DSM 15071]
MGEAASTTFTSEEFLAWEAEQPGKHEFVAGEAFAMGGASDRHATISLNIASALRDHLRGGPCRSFMADMKVRVDAADAFFYPDVLVTCDPADRERSHYKTAPTLIAEVLSPSTEAFDRGQKFAAYRQLPSLQEYLLIDPAQGSVELYRRDEADHWVLHAHGPGEAVSLASVACTLEEATIFEDAPPGPEPEAG